ncbi:MAG: hypothetical protein OXN83_03120 [Oligoflexia bacterium]|nr:hypothetical protein [Oligoflexia bacterium]
MFLIRSIYLPKAILILFLSASVVSCQTMIMENQKETCLQAAKMAGYKKGEFPKELLFGCITKVPAPAPESSRPRRSRLKNSDTMRFLQQQE